jgi:hypothetical protein
VSTTISSSHLATSLILHTVDSLTEPLPDKVSQVIKANSGIIPPKSSLSSYNDKYLAKHKECARRTQAALTSRLLLDASTKSANEKTLVATLGLKDVEMQEAIEGLQLLKKWKSDSTAYLAAAKKRWPEATVFGAES